MKKIDPEDLHAWKIAEFFPERYYKKPGDGSQIEIEKERKTCKDGRRLHNAPLRTHGRLSKEIF